MVHGNSKAMKLRDSELQVATSLCQIVTRERPSLTISRKCKDDHKHPTITDFVQKDGIGHMLIWDSKQNCSGFYKNKAICCIYHISH